MIILVSLAVFGLVCGLGMWAVESERESYVKDRMDTAKFVVSSYELLLLWLFLMMCFAVFCLALLFLFSSTLVTSFNCVAHTSTSLLLSAFQSITS